MKPSISIVFLLAAVTVLGIRALAAAESPHSAGPVPASAADAGLPAVADPPAPKTLQRSAQASPLSYTVQVGSFRERANAEALLAEIEAFYDDGYIVEVTQPSAGAFRVVSGRFDALEGALTREQALKIHGFATYVRRLAIPQSEPSVSLRQLDGWRLVAAQVDAAKR